MESLLSRNSQQVQPKYWQIYTKTTEGGERHTDLGVRKHSNYFLARICVTVCVCVCVCGCVCVCVGVGVCVCVGVGVCGCGWVVCGVCVYVQHNAYCHHNTAEYEEVDTTLRFTTQQTRQEQPT